MLEKRFWENKSLDELNALEWEALCDRCGICCLVKAMDIDNDEVFTTNIICENYDCSKKQCASYQNRQQKISHCTELTPALVKQFDWLPDSCAYRLRLNNKPLPLSHPLLSGITTNVNSVVEKMHHYGLVANTNDLDIEEHIIDIEPHFWS